MTKQAERSIKRIDVRHPMTGNMLSFDVAAELEFKDVTDEEWREFIYPDAAVKVTEPALICTKAPPPGTRGGGSLRIICLNGTVTYIPHGWVCLNWKPRPGFPSVAF